MTILLVGHRGVGKTSFLRTLRGTQNYDLDEEIEKATQLSIAELWKKGENHFRQLEGETLERLLQSPIEKKVIALGAGFEGPLPQNVRVVWLRQETDRDGRVFLNRPRLNPNLSPLDEYLERFEVREQRFQQWAHEQLVLPEGYTKGLESVVLEPSDVQAPFDFTLQPDHFKNFATFIQKSSQWNVRRFELRDDLLSEEQIEVAKEHIPPTKLLISARTHKAKEGIDDWALELGEPRQAPSILSLHQRLPDFAGTLETLNPHRGSILKLAVEVHSFAELRLGHQWWLQDPLRRAFLPRSKNGRWRWYRSMFGPKMPIHFFREGEGEGSALDQPFLWQVILQPPLQKYFAAVLGSPVQHSRSPMEHLDFFKARGIPFVAIDISPEEFSEAVNLLKDLGLKFAAVTSPLKAAAFEICDELAEEAQSLTSVNTLMLEGQNVSGHNTDVLALRDLRADFPMATDIWLWGGGGVRPAVRAAWPNMKEISARIGTTDSGTPDLLIWAASRAHSFKWPSQNVRPKMILDLNYSDNSPGREWAAVNNLPYHSGLKMFKLQAEYQRQIWRRSF